MSIPDYLAGNGVVYQTTDVQYVIANNNLWASPLDQQLKTTLVANPATSSGLGDCLSTAGERAGYAERVRQRVFTAVTMAGSSLAASGC